MAGKDYRIGKFTERVEFLEPVVVETESGARNNQYVTAESRDAEIVDFQLQSGEEQSAMVENETYVVKTWKVEGADTSWRLKWNEKIYQIDKVSKVTCSVSFYYIERIDLCNE